MNTRYSKLYTSHLNYWTEYPVPRHTYITNKLGTVYTNRKINLWISLFIKPQREAELLLALELNLANPFISTVNVILENSKIPTSLKKNPKLRIISKAAKWRTKYSDILSEIPEDSDDIQIIANSDIVISQTNLDFLFRLTPNDLAVLSRWETSVPFSKDIDTYSRNSRLINNIGSSDVWIFIQKPVSPCDIYLGIPGCENMFINEFYTENYNIVNLGNIIPSYHLHENLNGKESYPFTYYYAPTYNLIFIDFYTENQDFSLYNVFELHKCTDIYSKLSILFSAFWNTVPAVDGVSLEEIIDKECSLFKSTFLEKEVPKMKEELMIEERARMKAMIDKEHEEKERYIKSTLVSFQNNETTRVLKECEELRAREIEKINNELKEFIKEAKQKELEAMISEIRNSLTDLTAKQKEILEEDLKQQIAKEFEDRIRVIEEKCSKIYEERASEMGVKIYTLEKELEAKKQTLLQTFEELRVQKNKEIDEQDRILKDKVLSIKRQCNELYEKKTNEINAKVAKIEKTTLLELETRKQNLLKEVETIRDAVNREIETQQTLLKEKTKIFNIKHGELESSIADAEIEINNKSIELASNLFKLTAEFAEKKRLEEIKLREFQLELLKKQEEEKLKFKTLVEEEESKYKDKVSKFRSDYNTKIKDGSAKLTAYFTAEKTKLEEQLNLVKDNKIKDIQTETLLKQRELDEAKSALTKQLLESKEIEDELRKREYELKNEIDSAETIRNSKLAAIEEQCKKLLERETEKNNAYFLQERIEIDAKLTDVYNKKLAELTKAVSEKREYYVKYFEDKEREKQEAETNYKSTINEITENIEKTKQQLLECQTALSSSELVRKRKFLEIEEECEDFKQKKLNEINAQSKVEYETLVEQFNKKALENDEIERDKLKTDLTIYHEEELLEIKKRLEDETKVEIDKMNACLSERRKQVEEETGQLDNNLRLKKSLTELELSKLNEDFITKKNQFENEIISIQNDIESRKKIAQLEIIKLGEEFDSKRDAIIAEYQQIIAHNKDETQKAIESNMLQFTDTITSAHTALALEINNKRTKLESEVKNEINLYKKHIKSEIDKNKKKADDESHAYMLKIKQESDDYKQKSYFEIDEYNKKKQEELDSYKQVRYEEIDKYKAVSQKDIDLYKEERDNEINKHMQIKQEEINEYKIVRQREIDDYSAKKKQESDDYKIVTETEARLYKERVKKDADAYKERVEKNADRYKMDIEKGADEYKNITKNDADSYREKIQGEADAYKMHVEKEMTEYKNAAKTEIDGYKEQTRLAINKYKEAELFKINEECAVFRSKTLDDIDAEIIRIKQDKLLGIEKEYTTQRNNKLAQLTKEITEESEKIRSFLKDKEIVLEQERISNHKKSIKNLESDLNSKISHANKTHHDKVRTLNDEFGSHYKQLKQKLDDDIKTEQAKMYDQLKILRETETANIIVEHEMHKSKLKEEREFEHKKEIENLAAQVSEIVEEKRRLLLIDMAKDIDYARTREIEKLNAELLVYKNTRTTEINEAIASLKVTEEHLNKTIIETEASRIREFHAAQKLSKDTLDRLEAERHIQIENDIKSKILHAKEELKKSIETNDFLERERVDELKRYNDQVIEAYKIEKMASIDEIVKQDILSRKDKIDREISEYYSKEMSNVTAKLDEYQKQKTLEIDRKTDEQLINEKEVRLRELQDKIDSRDKDDIIKREERRKQHDIDLRNAVQEEKEKAVKQREQMIKEVNKIKHKLDEDRKSLDSILQDAKSKAADIIRSANEEASLMIEQSKREKAALDEEISVTRKNLEEEKKATMRKIIEAQKRAADLLSTELI